MPAGQLHGWSASQQLGQWARLQRELESSPGFIHDAINKVLAGQGSYDDLANEARTVVRTTWQDRVTDRIGC